MNEVFLDGELRRFLIEDLGHAEVDASPAHAVRAKVLVEQDGVMCGGDLMIRMLKMLSCTPDQVVVDRLLADGSDFRASDVVAELRVHPEVLRHGIRTGLNIMQALSGIATNTRDLVSRVADTGCTLLDTRKTTPGFRAFEKYAVRIGGGRNHRFNRLDGVILKKEDIAIDGGIEAAVCKAVKSAPYLVGIEVEVESLKQFDEALALPQVTHVLLDNMDPLTVRAAIVRAAGRKTLEASGVTADALRDYAETGIPFISTSALIREARPIKMKMRITP